MERNHGKDITKMDRFFKHILRLRDQRRTAVDEKRRVSVLVASSNCIGTTNNLFCDKWTGTSATDLTTPKKPDSDRA